MGKGGDGGGGFIRSKMDYIMFCVFQSWNINNNKTKYLNVNV